VPAYTWMASAGAVLLVGAVPVLVEVGVFSFNQFKNMTCGEGGAVLTNDPALLVRMLNAHDIGISYRAQDSSDSNAPVFLGNNYRISEIQGAILRVQLSRLPGVLDRMRRRVSVLHRALADRGYLIAIVMGGARCAYSRASWHLG